MPAARREPRKSGQKRGRRARWGADCQEGAISKCSFATVPNAGRGVAGVAAGALPQRLPRENAATKKRAKPVHRGEGRESALEKNSANLTKRTANPKVAALCAASSTVRTGYEKGRR
jgi:hypothetical protein